MVKGKWENSEDPISTIFLIDTDEIIRKKIMRAVTDAQDLQKMNLLANKLITCLISCL